MATSGAAWGRAHAEWGRAGPSRPVRAGEGLGMNWETIFAKTRPWPSGAGEVLGMHWDQLLFSLTRPLEG